MYQTGRDSVPKFLKNFGTDKEMIDDTFYQW